jgi:hypothetical protein
MDFHHVKVFPVAEGDGEVATVMFGTEFGKGFNQLVNRDEIRFIFRDG